MAMARAAGAGPHKSAAVKMKVSETENLTGRDGKERVKDPASTVRAIRTTHSKPGGFATVRRSESTRTDPPRTMTPSG